MRKSQIAFNLAVLSVLIFLVASRNEEKPDVKHNHFQFTVNENTTDSLNIEEVTKFIEEINLKYGEVVLAQCIIESGYFGSKLAKTNNNLLGMKHPGQRPTLSTGSKNGYAFYTSWKHCLIDYAIWQSKMIRHCKTKDQYIEFLSENYASDKNYRSKIISLIDGKK